MKKKKTNFNEPPCFCYFLLSFQARRLLSAGGVAIAMLTARFPAWKEMSEMWKSQTNSLFKK